MRPLETMIFSERRIPFSYCSSRYKILDTTEENNDLTYSNEPTPRGGTRLAQDLIYTHMSNIPSTLPKIWLIRYSSSPHSIPYSHPHSNIQTPYSTVSKSHNSLTSSSGAALGAEQRVRPHVTTPGPSTIQNTHSAPFRHRRRN